MTDRRKFMQGALALPMLTAGTLSLHAQEPWPARTITIVVPFPPGGVADFAAPARGVPVRHVRKKRLGGE